MSGGGIHPGVTRLLWFALRRGGPPGDSDIRSGRDVLFSLRRPPVVLAQTCSERNLMRRLAFALAAMFTLAVTRPVSSAEVVYLGDKLAPRQSIDAIEHKTWTVLLTKYVDANGLVDYRRWHDTRADLRLLDDYLRRLSSGDPKLPASDSSRLAFWINAYNAVTIRGILREYPTTSIRNHTPRLWGYNIWKHLQLYVAGQPRSLDQIEHEVLRKMNEPRIHFAIVCASMGCPRLLNEAYVAEKIDGQLEANAKDFFRRRQNFQHDARRQPVSYTHLRAHETF